MPKFDEKWKKAWKKILRVAYVYSSGISNSESSGRKFFI